MSTQRQSEIDQNYDFFQRNLKGFLQCHRGEFALLRSREVIDWFKNPGDAYRAGLARFSDEVFSIQEAEDQPAEMGMMSVAID